jgi:hypothetical protein
LAFNPIRTAFGVAETVGTGQPLVRLRLNPSPAGPARGPSRKPRARRLPETRPEKVLDLADEIELVDLPPDDLIQRLHECKIYVRDQIGRALQHFLGKPNLRTMRELATRDAAERVGAEMVNYVCAHGNRRTLASPAPAPTVSATRPRTASRGRCAGRKLWR